MQRLLGAWEQYELDVLKSLYYYRPTGQSPGPEREQMVIELELPVVYEEPAHDPKNPDRPNYSFPPEWTAKKKEAENNVKRARLFSHDFGITANHGGQDKDEIKATTGSTMC